jgi:cell division septum initiation protein DivIVA
MSIISEQLLKEMLQAAQKVLGKHWKETKPFAEEQFRLFSYNIQMIAEMKNKGQIHEDQARLQMRIQKNSIQMVMLSIEGLGIIAVETAINAALDVARKAVNTAIGWTLL